MAHLKTRATVTVAGPVATELREKLARAKTNAPAGPSAPGAAGRAPLDLAKQRVKQGGGWYECRRRAVRVDIRGGSCPVYISYPELSERKFPVVTIAELGAKYMTGGATVDSLKGHEIQACLHFGPIRTMVRTRMVQVDPSSAAIEFMEPDEATRDLIRDAFELELTAASLVPFHNFTSPIPGPTQTTVYSDGDAHVLELFVKNDQLVGVAGKLQVLDLRFVWSHAKPNRMKVMDMGEERTQGPHFRKRLMSFVRNLQGLSPKVKSELERVIATC